MDVITTAKFEEEVVKNAKPVLMMFTAPWCGYCKRLKPAVTQLAGEIAEQVKVGTVDTDQEPDLAQKFGIEVIPTLILMQNGQASEQLVNPPSKAKIKEWLQEKGAL